MGLVLLDLEDGDGAFVELPGRVGWWVLASCGVPEDLGLFDGCAEFWEFAGVLLGEKALVHLHVYLLASV